MEWDDDVLEENDVLISKWNSKTTDDTGQDIEELSSTIELMVLVDKSEEALVDGLTNHLSSWHKFGIKLVENVLKVVSLNRFLRIKKFQELLNKLWSYIHLQRSYLNCLVNNKLEEEFINSLQMRPSWVNLILSLDTSLREL